MNQMKAERESKFIDVKEMLTVGVILFICLGYYIVVGLKYYTIAGLKYLKIHWKNIILSRISKTILWFLGLIAGVLFIPYWLGLLAGIVISIQLALEPALAVAMYWSLGIIALMMIAGLAALWAFVYGKVKGG